MKKLAVLMVLMRVAMCNTYFLANVQCACQQFVSETDCSNRWNCLWTAITIQADATPTGYCQQQPCSAYTTQNECLKASQYCYYEAQTPGSTATACQSFTSCSSINLGIGQTSCYSANLSCMNAATEGTCKARTKPNQICSELPQDQCGSITETTIATDGICYWTQNNTCALITECSQITKNFCNAQNTNNACYWENGQCKAQTCATITTSQACTYVSASPIKLTDIQSCLWTPTSETTGTCANAVIGQLTASTCVSNTGSHYRWVGTTNGVCAQCNPYKYIFRNQCECEQLMQQGECTSASDCQWTNSKCTKSACTIYTFQQQCAQVPGCAWNPTSGQCASFTSCGSLTGATPQACLIQSVYCPGSNKTNCSSTLPQCSTITNPNICYNSIGSDGICTYTIAPAGCGPIISCTTLATKQLCDQFSNSCIWQFANKCQPKTCAQFLTKASCLYVQPNIDTNVVNICYWNPNTSQCSSFDNSIGYDVNTCFESTGRTHHWSEPSTANRGLCIPCHFSSLLNIKSQCSCTELTNYTDCAYSSPQCYWNSNSSTCAPQVCSYLTSQASCVMSLNCYWNNKNQGCLPVGSNTCSSLSGNTQQECLAQSIACAGTSGGKCSSSINSCSNFNTYYQCFGSVGTDGICQWNEVNKVCAGISECSMISTAAQCELVANACYWGTNAGTGVGSCSQLTCALLTSTACTFVRSSPNQNYSITQCTLSAGACVDGTNTLTSSTCYVKSGRTSRWDATDSSCVKCYSVIISVLAAILLIIA